MMTGWCGVLVNICSEIHICPSIWRLQAVRYASRWKT